MSQQQSNTHTTSSGVDQHITHQIIFQIGDLEDSTEPVDQIEPPVGAGLSETESTWTRKIVTNLPEQEMGGSPDVGPAVAVADDLNPLPVPDSIILETGDCSGQVGLDGLHELSPFSSLNIMEPGAADGTFGSSCMYKMYSPWFPLYTYIYIAIDLYL